MASWMRAWVSGRIRSALPLSTFDTELTETCARRATSWIVVTLLILFLKCIVLLYRYLSYLASYGKFPEESRICLCKYAYCHGHAFMLVFDKSIYYNDTLRRRHD